MDGIPRASSLSFVASIRDSFLVVPLPVMGHGSDGLSGGGTTNVLPYLPCSMEHHQRIGFTIAEDMLNLMVPKNLCGWPVQPDGSAHR